MRRIIVHQLDMRIIYREFQGRTPNSEVQEFGVRPWNSRAVGPRLFKAEVQFLFRSIHVLLEKLFPDFRPRPIEHIRDPVLNDLPRRNLGGESIDWVKRPRAFGPCEPRGVTP